MSPPFSDSSASLTALVAFLDARRETILKNWRMACAQDPTLTNAEVLSHIDFNDSLPTVLTILQQRLVGKSEEGDIARIAIAHGLQRRHKAHLIIETVRELNHLTQTLYNELTHFQQLFPDTDHKLFWQVQQHMTQIMAEIINGSIQIYDELQRSEAAERAAALQKALDQMRTLSNERSDRLRTSMHDLGSGFGIISGAANLLNREGASAQNQAHYLDMLSRNLGSVQAMLTNLMDLSRLEAGQETLRIQPVNAAQLLKDISMSVQPIAQQRGLVLRAEGPSSLPVETDPIKLQRIIQNLLLNALTYTSAGFIEVSWARQDDQQWMFRIHDSGPGLPVHIATVLTEHLKPVSNALDPVKPKRHEPSSVVAGAMNERKAVSALDQSASRSSKGEGIGLTIVKEFSQLLQAKLEVETAPGQGTSFGLWLPMRYRGGGH
ncbi:sensor histidine kinase [Spirosoma soli]|uniref:histidine kinase n=1 Tax=Spirosoma soli TaxID=1770529 RepID=A0ABW5LY80_9BACT